MCGVEKSNHVISFLKGCDSAEWPCRTNAITTVDEWVGAADAKVQQPRPRSKCCPQQLQPNECSHIQHEHPFACNPHLEQLFGHAFERLDVELIQ